MSTKTIEEESHHEESDITDEFIDDDGDKLSNVPGGTGRTVTLQMLMAANILQPGKSAMTIEYLGQKFVGDLLPDGKIKSHETETIFCSPSAWAIYCKRIINPDKKSGCGWASVKYKGKKLDAYKAIWTRKCQQQRDQREPTPTDEIVEDLENENDKTSMEPPPPPVRRNVVQHNTISNRNVLHDSNTLIETVPFSTLGKMQPFLVSVTTSTVLLMDFHCHLTNNEVCGYLGGSWDINSHNLSITHAFPCRNTRFDRDKSALCELQIQKLMVKKNLNLVGWYHSHPRFPVQPTLRDCDAQLEYQIRMRGPTEASYTPCVGFICSPYNDDNTSLESNIMSFWVIPPPENRPLEYGRPMLMSYTVNQDETLCEDIKEEMMLTVDYYKQFNRELINFEGKFKNDVTYIEKLKKTLLPKFPLDQNNGHFWNFIRELLGLDLEDIVIPEPPPPKPESQIISTANSIDDDNLHSDMKNDDDFDGISDMGDSDVMSSKDDDCKQPSVAIPSLQAQLRKPSGLNMTPSPLSSALVLGTNLTNPNQTGSGTTNTSSPRDSPITIPSNSASPAKFEIPIRASPSPAKSDTSSCRSRTRNSPAPSPGKLSINDILGGPRNSPSLSSLLGNIGNSSTNMNELYAATLASLSSTLPPGLLTSDYASLFQNPKGNDYGLSALSSLASAAAASASGTSSTSMNDHHMNSHNKNQSKQSSSGPSTSTSTSTSALPSIPNMKEFMQQLEKGNLSLLMQSQYNNQMNALTPSPAPSPSLSTNKSSSHKSSKHQSQSRKTHNPMMDYNDFNNKFDQSKLADLMKSPEYTQMLLQQAQALSGLGSEISIVKKPQKKTSASNLLAKLKSIFSTDSYLPPLPSVADVSLLIEQAQKVPEVRQILNDGNVDEINVLLQAQMLSNNALDFATFTGSGTNDYSQKMPSSGPTSASMSQYMAASNLTALFEPVSRTPTTSKSSKSSKAERDRATTNSAANPAEMLNSLFTSAVGEQNEINALLYQQSKAADLNMLFNSNVNSASTSTSPAAAVAAAAAAAKQSLDYLSLFPQFSSAKIQEMSSLFQHEKYEIPDPLAKATLEANNMYLAPSASLLKLQQEAFNSMMMKPPKSSSSSSSSKIETPPPVSASPGIIDKRSTPTKSASRDSPSLSSVNPKYNFSAADLAVSSVPLASSSPIIPADLSRKALHTPPVDMSSSPSATPSSSIIPPYKKRMEFSSIADLVAAPPPSKMPKLSSENLDP